MMSDTDVTELTDGQLWPAVLQGDRQAYATIVRRHQSAVTAVAFGQCGDLPTSEDVAQETFWNAWANRDQLQRPEHVRAWLCGISRNLARGSRRRQARRARLNAAQASTAELPAPDGDPVHQSITQEEQTLVWDALERIPDTYREPLVLFYREQQSVAEVATALDLSREAVRQRLSRGRALLRDHVAAVVEGTLRRSRPGRAFTLAVMTGLATGGKSAMATGGSTLAAGATASGSSLAAGGVAAGAGLGPLIGILGGWLGAFLPAQLAPTREEHDVLTRSAVRLTLGTLLFALVIVVLVVFGRPRLTAPAFAGTLAVAVIGHITSVMLICLRTQRRIRQLRERLPQSDDEPPTRAGRWLRAHQQRLEGRRYRSRRQFLGIPLIDVQVSDPDPLQIVGTEPRRAFGWVAVGDQATGILLAAGGRARGLIAVGGVAIGGIAVGGLGLGVIAVAGLSLGLLSLGGLAAGGLALGGAALGWTAAGGGAAAVDTAVGGGAIAGHAAFGGAAIARDYAVGGYAVAEHANDPVARALFEDHWLRLGLEAINTHNTAFTAVVVAISVLPALIMSRLLYRRRASVTDADRAARTP